MECFESVCRINNNGKRNKIICVKANEGKDRNRNRAEREKVGER